MRITTATVFEKIFEHNHKDYTVQALPMLNHFFQTSQTGAISEYAQIEETVSPVDLDIISDWILKRTLTTSL